ncbi:hypothetical protein ACFQ0I_02465 [Mariniflexile aquimaris]|uniref:Uncharacterized protein n=1 Tax=Mariniflexile aquimaris TaxID=881009 RepID=A0ABW3BPJ7_9FLAO
MKISIVLVSTLLIISVFLPFFIFIFNGTKNTSSTKKRITSLIKDNGIIYSLTEFWRKNFIGLSNDNKILTIATVKDSEVTFNNINLEELKICNVIKNYNKDKDGIVRLKSLGLELIFKFPSNKNLMIPFFNIDDDLIEDFEIQRIEKWHKLITDAIVKSPSVKLAS